MDHARMIRQLNVELFEDSSASKLVCEGLVCRRPQRRQSVGVEYLSLGILRVFATKLVQGICIGTHARCVLELVASAVKHFDRRDIIALASVLPTYGFGLFD